MKGKYDWKNLGKTTVRALPALSLIVIVIGGIVIGVFTATEGSAIAVVYALILGICYRNITVKSFWKIVVDSAKMSGMVVFLIGVSNILGWVMAFLQIPQAVSAALLGITDNYVLILLIMNVILLIAGTFMDVTPAILIFTPLFLPIVQTFGMHPVHFGLILVYNLCIGNITPPVGNTLFVIDQSWKYNTVKNYAVYDVVLFCDFSRASSGDLRTIFEYGSSYGSRADLSKRDAEKRPFVPGNDIPWSEWSFWSL